MKEVIRMYAVPMKQNDPVKFTHCFSEDDGWLESKTPPKYYEKVVYLGESRINGDMFAAYKSDIINIFKGHLNSGKY